MAEIIGKRKIKLASVDSTNNYATKMVSGGGCDEGTVIVAEKQECGRGQMHNSWESEGSKNILVSIVFYPFFLPVQYQFLLSKVVALGVYELVSLYVDNVTIKWPNDIYVGEQKIAGILIENSIMGYTLGSTVAGVGININQATFKGDAPNPVSLFQLLGREFYIEELLEILFDAIDKWYLLLKSGKHDQINSSYLECLYRKGVLADYCDKTGRYKGTITGISEIGQLEIQPETGQMKTYHFKEVEFL